MRAEGSHLSAEWRPDFGPGLPKRRPLGSDGGQARDFLIAVNFNLNTTSTRRANAIAFDVREKAAQNAKATR